MCLPMLTHWRQLANTTELVLPSVHPSPQSKRQINRFGRSCIAHNWKSLYLQWALLSPQNSPLPWGNLDPHLIRGSLGPPESSTQMASRSVQPFLHLDDHRVSVYFTMGCPFPPSKMPFPCRDLNRHLMHGSWPTWVLNPNSISIGSAVFVAVTSVTDRQTTLLCR